MLRSRRFAFIAAASLLGLAGCGDAARTTSSGPVPAVIHLGSAGSAGRASSAPTADKMMPYGSFDFVVDGTLPVLADHGTAWKLPAGQTLDQARLARMAKALGVSGAVHAVPAAQGGGWQVGSADSGPSITVSADGLLSWWYSPSSSGSASTGAGCATTGVAVPDAPAPVATDGAIVEPAPTPLPSPPDTVVPCSTPTPPKGVPSKDAASARAKALLSGLGYDTGKYQFEAYADDWSASATAYLMIDGTRSPLTVSVGFGAGGAITWAGGTLATPVQAGSYPLVGTTLGLQRLKDGAWMGTYGAPGAVLRTASTAVANSSASATGPATPSQTVAVGSGRSSGSGGSATVIAPTPETIPVDQPVCNTATNCVPDTVPTPQPVTVHLVSVRAELTLEFDVDGTAWLLPAYTFVAADGGTYTVIAVDSQFVDLPSATTVVPPTPDTAGATPGQPGTGTGSGSGGGSGGPVVTLPAKVDQALAAKVLVGAKEPAAATLAAAQGWTVRVVKRDGESLIVTDDYSPTRVDVVVVGGVITAVDSIG